jgi:threonylcarbamoyladenosine tRNA methylthiotransferase MtaB
MEKRSMRIALDTLGCKLNQAETELLARQFVEAGHSLVSRLVEADVYILNTCTVTHVADSKARRLLRMAHRQNPSALVVAAGCYAQRAPGELEQIEGVGLVAGNDDKLNLLKLVERAGSSRQRGLAGNSGAEVRTRSLVKVQDGCNSFCAYCIVPVVRGREKSLPADEIVNEVKHRVADGYKEVVLTGTKIGSYSDGGVGLEGLLEGILDETDVARLRLSSLQPQEISPGLIGLWGDERLCPHFHLALQSGSDGVLDRMKRQYSVSDYEKAVSLIRGQVPEAAITTDIIVGFPGETEEDFEESYRLCREMEFARIHVFNYSPRAGTEAALLSHPVESKVRKQRSQRMLALAEKSIENFRRRFSGKTMTVLWEKQSGRGVWSGMTGNYIKVYKESDEDLSNRMLPVKLA